MNWPLLQNSLLIAASAACLAATLGLAAAVGHLFLSARLRLGLKTLAILSLAWPPFFVANTWLEVLAPGSFLRQMGLNPLTLGTASVVLGLMLWPIPFLFVSGAWSRVQPASLECNLEVTGWQLWRAVLWPECGASLGAAWVLSFVLALNNFAVPAILQVRVLPAEVWIAFSTLFQPGAALLQGLPLILAPLAAVVYLSFQARAVPLRDSGSPVPAALWRMQLGWAWTWGSVAVSTVACGLSAILPAAVLLLNSKTWVQLPGAVAAGSNALWNSLWQPVCAATILCVVALLCSAPRVGGQRRSPRDLAAVARGLLWVPFFAPGVMLGICLIWLLNRPGLDWLYQSAGVVLLALAIRYAAVAATPIRAILASSDSAVLDAARLGGAGRLRILRHILLPSSLPQIAAVWYVIYLLVLWDVETVLLLYPPGTETLAFNVFNLLHYGYAGEVNAVCVILAVLALLPFGLWHLISGCAQRVQRSASIGVLGWSVIALFGGCTRERAPHRAELPGAHFESALVVGARGAGIGQFNKPRSVAVDAQDCVYAVDMTGRVQKFSPDGVFVLSWQMPQTDLGKPKGMTRGSDGEIVVIEPHYQRLTHYDPTGKLLAQWGTRGTHAGAFTLPRGVAINGTGEVYVSEYTASERVQWFSKHGRQFLGAFGRAGTAPGEFNRPEGICVDAESRVYVADSCNHRIQIFSREGKLLRMYGSAGKGPGELSYPYDICVDGEGTQYVCEFGNSRIQLFDKDCKPIEMIGGPGSKPGQFSNPWGIALDSGGNLWVADSMNHRLQKLARRGGAAGRS